MIRAPLQPTVLDDVGNRALDAIGWTAERVWPLGIFKAAVFLLAWWIAARVVVNLAIRVVKQLTKHTKTSLDDRLIQIAEKPTRRLIVIAGLYYALDALPLPERAHRLTTGVVYVAAVWVAVRLVHALILLLLTAYGHSAHADRDSKIQFEKDYLPLLSKVMGTVLAVVGLTLVLNHFGQNVQTLVAAVGVGGIAIGFAAKDVLGNMMAGFVILTDRPFRPGDRIKLASGETGDVVAVGTRSTRVKLFDGNTLIVPNAELTNTRVVNFNFPNSMMRGTIEVGVAYGTDLESCKKLVTEVITSQPEVAADPPPVVLFTKFGDWALTLNAYFWVTDYTLVGTAEDKIRAIVYQRFAAGGIKIPFPTREILGAGGGPGGAGGANARERAVAD